MGPILPIIKKYFGYFLSSHFGITICSNCPSVFQPWDCRNRQGVYLRKPFYILLYISRIHLVFVCLLKSGLRQFTFHHAYRRPSLPVWSKISSVMTPVAIRCLMDAVGCWIVFVLEGFMLSHRPCFVGRAMIAIHLMLVASFCTGQPCMWWCLTDILPAGSHLAYIRTWYWKQLCMVYAKL